MRSHHLQSLPLPLLTWLAPQSDRLGLVLFSVAFAVPRSAMADPIKATLEVKVAGGYARLVFSMSETTTRACARPAMC